MNTSNLIIQNNETSSDVYLQLTGNHTVAWFLFLDIVDEGANSMTDPDIYFIPILKVNRWILDKANAFRGSSQDDAARFESGALGEEGDGLTDVEYLIAETGHGMVIR